jgi:DNA-binding protein H-NS
MNDTEVSMAQTYAQIQKKIAALQKEADALRQREVAGVVSRIKVAIEHYGLTAEQLGLGGTKATAKVASKANGTTGKAAAGVAKFSDGNGNIWSGMGPRPQWLRTALEAGKSLEEFRTAGAAAAAPKKSGKPVKRRPTRVLYRDGSGNAWTGRGPQPRWLKEAVASGKTLEEMKA